MSGHPGFLPLGRFFFSFTYMMFNQAQQQFASNLPCRVENPHTFIASVICVQVYYAKYKQVICTECSQSHETILQSDQ